MKIIKFFLFFLILNTYYLILDTDCLAQAFLGISAIPPRLEISVEPGKTITKEIKVRNESPVEKIISTKVKDFVVVDDTGTPSKLKVRATLPTVGPLLPGFRFPPPASN